MVQYMRIIVLVAVLLVGTASAYPQTRRDRQVDADVDVDAKTDADAPADADLNTLEEDSVTIAPRSFPTAADNNNSDDDGSYSGAVEETNILGLPSNATSIRANIVDTFSCEGRSYGYYADVENECQIFHVCLPVVNAGGRGQTFKWSFICPEQTIFNQEVFTCTRPEDSVPCEESAQFYNLNENFGVTTKPGQEVAARSGGIDVDVTARAGNAAVDVDVASRAGVEDVAVATGEGVDVAAKEVVEDVAVATEEETSPATQEEATTETVAAEES